MIVIRDLVLTQDGVVSGAIVNVAPTAAFDVSLSTGREFETFGAVGPR